jgi:hypothetical protein
MNRLQEHLSPSQQEEVCASFRRRLMLTDAMNAANLLLELNHDKFRIHRDGMEVFLQETCPDAWREFKLKPKKTSTLEKAKAIVSAIRGKNPFPDNKPHAPDSVRYGTDEKPRKSRAVTTIRGTWGLGQVEEEYHNKQADKAIIRELSPDGLTATERRLQAEARKKQEEEQNE